ncbi:hypothetical protein TNCV_3530361 [Trichonephila clavipes]|uniref:Uncharacterized protein n=1 Tax=Trichonephila clavipes TaxID=2585209 RepID=A0A8X6RFX9_TRICX|nr:hypothetical protein TNCV_3530361 [Trichonephila clavipes]
MPPHRQRHQIKIHEIYRDEGLDVYACLVSFIFEHHTGDSMSWLVFNSIFLASLSTNLTRGLAARWLFKVPPCRKGTIHLQTSMPSPGFELRPYGIIVSVTNHYTGWVNFANISHIKLHKIPRRGKSNSAFRR